MAVLRIPGIELKGVAAAVPSNIISNLDYGWISQKDRKQLISTTGILERRFADKGVCSSDLCFVAAERLLNDLGWKASEVEMLVFVSQLRDYKLPCTAPILQYRLGLPKSAITFDIPLGCSGYVYGLSTLASMMSHSGIRKGLLLAGDVCSADLSYKDKSTYPLFGDAGTATALTKNSNASNMIFDLQSDGSGHKAIHIPDGGSRNPITRDSFRLKQHGKGIYRSRKHVSLDGLKVFQFTMDEVTPNIINVLGEAKKELKDIDYYVLHQANKIMNETIRKILKMETAKFPLSLEKFGNTSSASIPLTMVSNIGEQLSSGNLKLLLSGFGIGLSWGSAYLETSGICCPDLIETDSDKA